MDGLITTVDSSRVVAIRTTSQTQDEADEVCGRFGNINKRKGFGYIRGWLDVDFGTDCVDLFPCFQASIR